MLNHRPKIIFWALFFLGIVFILIGTFLLLEPNFYFCRTRKEPIDKQSLYCLVNKARHKNKIRILKPNTKLEKAAKLRAFDIVAQNQFSHRSIGGLEKMETVKQEGYNPITIGEILGQKFHSNEDMFNTWMNSASHSAVILNPHYQDVGISVVDSGKLPEEKVVVGLFGLEKNK